MAKSSIRKCKNCGAKFQAYASHIKRGQMRFCSHKCFCDQRRSETTIERDGDVYHISRGYYVCTKTGKRLHRVIWEEKYGPIPDGFVIHHKDGDKSNNSLANLELQPWGDHTRLHNKIGARRLPIKPKTFCRCGALARARGLCTKHYQQLKAELIKKGLWP